MKQGEQLIIGNADQLRTHFSALAKVGVERFYVWFCDFAALATLAAFGRDVISPLRA